MAVAGLPTTGVAAAAVAGASPAAESGPVTITTLNPTIRLYPAKALGRMGDIRFGTAEIGTMMPFLGAGEITWTVSVPEAGRYDLALCCSTTNAGQPAHVTAGKTRIAFALPGTAVDRKSGVSGKVGSIRVHSRG